ncbi:MULTISPECIES: CotH kinase family protein [unclassified Bacillus (in: firmicutes)]|uniref:CotH kinase family protein n=1 Tax=unclassified Bacillus (in: firmicutes) TaxID=185979 RepID=UPI0008ECB588|nr:MULTISPECIES: CotH kinase family protein [unclassified Bacillus (in: firmicutes)]SFA71980.1 spore coat protein H [Bacillus sp. UNCCL13]SFQ62273.1 spore coat protein H [Bacillus sp. cl95]
MDENTQLPLYKMFIHPMDLKELRRDIWIDDPVPAQLTLEGKKVEIDVAYRGSHIRDFLKKSYQIGFFRPTKFKGVKQVHLNAEFKDPSMIRNKLSFDFFSEIGCLAPRSRHVILTINGKTEGVYLEIESVDENFLSKRKLPSGAIFYAVDGDANFSLMSDLDKETKKSLELGYERKCGEELDDFHLQELIYQINTILPEDFESRITQYVNVDQYFRWMAGIIFCQNYDGFVHNYALYRNGETGLFEVIPWDYDATWGRDVNGKVMEANYVPITGYNTLTARLLDVPNFRKKYRDMLEEILENQFTTEFMMPRAEMIQKSIRPYILQDPYKKESVASFDQELEVIRDYIEERRKYLKSRLNKLD